jgi:hypothetical protein
MKVSSSTLVIDPGAAHFRSGLGNADQPRISSCELSLGESVFTRKGVTDFETFEKQVIRALGEERITGGSDTIILTSVIVVLLLSALWSHLLSSFDELHLALRCSFVMFLLGLTRIVQLPSLGSKQARERCAEILIESIGAQGVAFCLGNGMLKNEKEEFPIHLRGVAIICFT